ncbi:MAG: bifunctional folylpolyglutamate synthase/dihydrofolate synthase [Opitutae bacterium]|nr:bifunctional folylpolyglutamate synthase/dihydrofolate synthase [Opitutae bacterium]
MEKIHRGAGEPIPRLPTSIEDAVSFLFGLRNRGSTFGIHRMKAFAELLGHPELEYPVIHVAGTNGKGSVCAMLEACFRANGLKTGLFTSPHLVRLGERIRVDGQEISDQVIVDCAEWMRSLADQVLSSSPELYPSFFEFVAAMAFHVFARDQVDVAIVETGLGGRLDATNIVKPVVSIITSIGLDHCDILGYDIASIAREKAGILKMQKPVVLGWLPEEAEAVVREIAANLECPVVVTSRLQGMELPKTSLAGSFQRRNAAVTIATCELLRDRFALQISKCRNALLGVQWPGRWQKLQVFGRTVILDATHNAEGCLCLDEHLNGLREKPIVLVGTLGEVRASDLMKVVARYAREIRLLVPSQPRACSYDILEKAIPQEFSGKVTRSSIMQEFPLAYSCEVEDVPIVVTGSIYLLGEVLARIEGNNCHTPLQDWV